MTEFKKGDVGFAWDDDNLDNLVDAILIEYDVHGRFPYLCTIKCPWKDKWEVYYYTNFSKTDPREKDVNNGKND